MKRSFSDQKPLTAEEWLAAAEQFIAGRPAFEPWEPMPYDHTEDGTPIFSSPDWLKIYLHNHQVGDPVPKWLDDFPLFVGVDEVRRVIEYLIQLTAREASDAKPLAGVNIRRMSASQNLEKRIRAAAVEEKYRGMQKSRWKAELAERFGLSPKTIHRHLGGMEPPAR